MMPSWPCHPDPNAVNHIEHALKILREGDVRVSEADRFLSQIRSSPTIWPVLTTLIHSPASSYSALGFAASTLYARIRADWFVFNDGTRSSAFALAVDGACRGAVASSLGSPAYFFGRGCGFAISMSQPPVREMMWNLLQEKLSVRPVLKCDVLAAVVKEVDETSTRDVAKHMEGQAFCHEKGVEVIPIATTILHAVQSCPQMSNEQIQGLRAAVLCIHAWQRYGEKCVMVNALMRVLIIPQLADDVAEAINEIIGYSGASLMLLARTCEGLVSSFQAAQGMAAAHIVHHAIAEVACVLSFGNADELMEQDCADSRLVVRSATELLWMCVKSPDDRSFFAAVEGWGSWISAENLVSENQRKLGRQQVTAIIDVVVRRMHTLRFIVATVQCEEGASSEYADERGVLTDLLLEASTCVGVDEYVSTILPLLSRQSVASPVVICSALVALSVGGDAIENSHCTGHVKEIVLGMLERVMEVLDSCSKCNISGDVNAQACIAIRQSCLTVLSCYAYALAIHGSSVTLYNVVRWAGTGMLDESVCECAARLLCELAERNSNRLICFLSELIPSVTGTLQRMSNKAAEQSICGLARIGSSLPSHAGRLKALQEILQKPCEQLKWICSERIVAENEPKVCLDLTLISTAMQEMNDNEASGVIFYGLQDFIFDIAVQHCASNTVSRAVCRLLEVCVLPTLIDDDTSAVQENRQGIYVKDDRKGRQEEEGRTEVSRLELALSCTMVAGECFRRSGPHGETCWLKAMGEISTQMLGCIEGSSQEEEQKVLTCVSVCVRHALAGLGEFCGGDYDTQPEMTVAYFKFISRLMARIGGALTSHAPALTRIALGALRCSSLTIVRESLAFWKVVFSSVTPRETAAVMLCAGGGLHGVTAGVLCAAQMTRCTGNVADVLFAMCRAVDERQDAGVVLQGCLKAAFEVEGVPCNGLDRGVKEMLFKGCYCSAGSKKEFRRALNEVGRVCGMSTQ